MVVLLLCPVCMEAQRMTTPVDNYIAAFRKGQEFNGPSEGLTVGGKPHRPSGRIMQGQPDMDALEKLRKELASGDAFVRRNVVALLVDVGLQVDPRRPEGTEALRDKDIIEILVKEGLSRRDAGREEALDALRKLVRPADLALHGDTFARALQEKPTEDAFLLVAKAKAMAAKPLVEQLAQNPPWKDNEATKIAQAALGDRELEAAFIKQAAEAHKSGDSEKFMRSLGPLAMMGTPESLKAIAGYLRTPLTFLVPGTMEKSLRLNVLEALLYHYPDQPVLYPNNINSAADYTAAERFCTKELGVTYEGPEPPFMTFRPFPVPLQQ
jgi:hypothetical protein